MLQDLCQHAIAVPHVIIGPSSGEVRPSGSESSGNNCNAEGGKRSEERNAWLAMEALAGRRRQFDSWLCVFGHGINDPSLCGHAFHSGGACSRTYNELPESRSCATSYVFEQLLNLILEEAAKVVMRCTDCVLSCGCAWQTSCFLTTPDQSTASFCHACSMHPQIGMSLFDNK